MKTFYVSLIISSLLASCGSHTDNHTEQLMHRAYNNVAKVQQLTKQQIKFPLTAKFDELTDVGIEDTDANTVSIMGKGQCTNGFGVPVAFRYAALIHIDSLQDSIIKLVVR